MLKRFWKTGKEKRREFLDKLKGTSSFEVSKNAPTGSIFMLTNKGTGGVESYVSVGGDRWILFGTNIRIGSNTFTRRQLEMHLTRLVRESDANSIHIMDQGWVKPL